MTSTPCRLVLMRHAKAVSWGPEDHARELEPSGRRAAAAAGTWLAGLGFRPDLALVSSAARTMGTWEEAASAAGFSCPVESSHALYAAEVDSALDLVRATDESVRALVVVGHNPTISSLAQLLDDGEGAPAAAASMTAGFAPAAAAHFTHTANWADLDHFTATLTAFRPGQG